jgi:hypothetical protein
MELKLSRHAITRIVGQGISEDMVQAVLNDPRWMPAVGPNTCYDGIVPDGRRLRVVLAEEHPVPVLVTAHWVDRD